MKKIIVSILVVLAIAGLYVGDFFWVENYKDIPYDMKHVFTDLATYKMYDHIISAVVAAIVAGIIVFMIMRFYTKPKNNEEVN